MSWWALLVLVTIAAWRTYVWTARDLILDRWRDRYAPVGTGRRDFLECPYCAGYWWAGAWVITAACVMELPTDPLGVVVTVASWWAAAAGVVFIESLVDWVNAHS